MVQTIEFPIAEPNIEELLEQFLSDKRKLLFQPPPVSPLWFIRLP